VNANPVEIPFHEVSQISASLSDLVFFHFVLTRKRILHHLKIFLLCPSTTTTALLSPTLVAEALTEHDNTLLEISSLLVDARWINMTSEIN